MSRPLANRDSEALIKLIIDYSIHTRLINPVAETNVAGREGKTQQKNNISANYKKLNLLTSMNVSKIRKACIINI